MSQAKTSDPIREHKIKWLKLVSAMSDDKVLSVVKEKIRRNPIWFFNTFLWTYDPRKDVKTLPFKLYPFQEDYIRKLDAAYTGKSNLLCEKSRDMGFSWLTLGYIVWRCLTTKGFSAGIGSRKALLVDEIGNMKSLMQRVRFMLNMVPPTLRCGYIESKHSKRGLILIPETESIISGEAGDDIGRGDRTSMYFIDEFAFIPRSSLVQAAVSQTSDCIVYGSTPNGKGNEFARLRFKTEIPRVTFHWRDHPDKDMAWYERQKALLDDATLAQEVDISYAKSTTGKVYKWFDADVHAKDPLSYNSKHPLMATFDWGIGDPTACLLVQYYGGILYVIDAFEEQDKTIERVFGVLQSHLSSYGLRIADIVAWYGDPDARNRNPVHGDSIASFLLARYGIRLRFKVPNVISNRIMSVRMLGEKGRIKVSKKLHHVIECFENYRFPEKEHGENEKPVHDWTSHTMSALEYYCVYEHGLDQYNKNSNIITVSNWR